MPLKRGDKAPNFTLLDQEGNSFTLSKSLKERKVRHFIYFYPQGRHDDRLLLASD